MTQNQLPHTTKELGSMIHSEYLEGKCTGHFATWLTWNVLSRMKVQENICFYKNYNTGGSSKVYQLLRNMDVPLWYQANRQKGLMGQEHARHCNKFNELKLA